ncbi:cell surface glycoprotein CD200 receptor 1-B-like isoform X1 [Dermochelys coriacea]|uniref:cell surface glycoprotein CD200 receptor 1-B-like isoform X1 n=1 Tax=Dermochelys coriacea TaxID=27794 RepID=UPI0018E7D686|nr:cell surface glycoprotein CD200 receptor 1-B-like isoform X1 [Dermochelys coriacea]XP_043365698.1 cell surface glycoprotein CD200 receptor 1-B-like isoform X1 [Dermochelys coriacea]
MWPILAEFLLFLIKVVQGPADSTVSAVVGTRAVLRCHNTSESSLISVVWKIRPKTGSHCLLAYRVDTNKTDKTNCNERMTWESSPYHNPALQIHPVRLADEGNYTCEIANSDGTFCLVSALTVLVPPAVTLTHDSNGVVVCHASAGKPAAEISWAQGSGRSTENKTHHTNGTVTTLSSMPMINSTNAHVTCLVTHPAMNQTQTIELSPKLSADMTLSPILHYFLICTSSCVAVAVVALILYRTLKCRVSWLTGLADTATMLNTFVCSECLSVAVIHAELLCCLFLAVVLSPSRLVTVGPLLWRLGITSNSHPGLGQLTQLTLPPWKVSIRITVYRTYIKRLIL